MKPIYLSILTLILAGVVSYVTAKAVQPRASTPTTTEAKVKKSYESVYDRVMRTGKIRCGYIPYSYAFKIDPNTGGKSGVLYDVMNELGRLANLEIEWTEELTWATLTTSLQTGRVDAFCSGMWAEIQNGKFISFSQPLYYNALSAYGRAEETRFTTLSDLNDSNIGIVSTDGGISGIVQAQDFPKSKLISLPNSTSYAEQVSHVLTKKADVFLFGDDHMVDFMNKNPGQIKALFKEKIRTYPVVIGFPNDFQMKNLIQNALVEVSSGNIIKTSLETHALEGTYLIPAKSYETAE